MTRGGSLPKPPPYTRSVLCGGSEFPVTVCVQSEAGKLWMAVVRAEVSVRQDVPRLCLPARLAGAWPPRSAPRPWGR